MKRRSLVVAAAGAVAALPLLPPDLQAFTRAVRARMGGGLRTLDPHQHATVTTVADLIIPATDTPPASAGNVAGFVDVVLSDWYADDDKAAFLYARVAWPHNLISDRAVNQRRAYPPFEGTIKAVAETLFSAATLCIPASSNHESKRQTAAGFPLKG